MKYVIQTLYILAFFALGKGVSFLTGGVLPGSILGMLFLFVALCTGLVKEDRVADVSSLLIRNMMLFFVPVTVGVMVAWDKVSQNIVSISVALVVSLILVIATVGLIQQKLGKKW